MLGVFFADFSVSLQLNEILTQFVVAWLLFFFEYIWGFFACVCMNLVLRHPEGSFRSLNECVSFQSFQQIRQLGSDLVVWAGDEATSSNII